MPSTSNGVFVNGRRLIYRSCGAILETIDPCFLPDGSTEDFPNIASADDAIGTTGSVLIEGLPACNKSSQLSTTAGSESGIAGVSSGSIAGPCDFLSASDNVFIEGNGALRNMDIGVANNKNTAPAPIQYPGSTGVLNLVHKKFEDIIAVTKGKWLDIFVWGKYKSSKLLKQHLFLTTTDNKALQHKLIVQQDLENVTNLSSKQQGDIVRYRKIPEHSNYNLWLVLSDIMVQYEEKHYSLIEELKHAWQTSYLIPLFFSIEQARAEPILEQDKKIANYNKGYEVAEFIPLRIDYLGELGMLREGWLYLFRDNYLWREIKVIRQENFSTTKLYYFKDVNLISEQGEHDRSAEVESQDSFIVVPVLENGEKCNISIAFSEVQWSWNYIVKLGGMNKTDPRCNATIQDKFSAITTDHKLREKRLEKLDFGGYKQNKIAKKEKNSNVIWKNKVVIPISEMKYDKNSEEHCAILNIKKLYDLDIPIVAVHDAIGVAREFSAQYNYAIYYFKQIVAVINGNYNLDSNQFRTETHKHSIKNKVANKQCRTKLASLLYNNFFSDNNEAIVAKELKKVKESLSKNKIKKELHFELREEIIKILNRYKSQLIDWLDSKNENNFSHAMIDSCALHKDKVYLRYKVLGEILHNTHILPINLDNNLPKIDIDVSKSIIDDSAYNFYKKLTNFHSRKDCHPLFSLLFAKENGADPELLESVEIPKLEDQGTPGLDLEDIFELSGMDEKYYESAIAKLGVMFSACGEDKIQIAIDRCMAFRRGSNLIRLRVPVMPYVYGVTVPGINSTNNASSFLPQLKPSATRDINLYYDSDSGGFNEQKNLVAALSLSEAKNINANQVDLWLTYYSNLEKNHGENISKILKKQSYQTLIVNEYIPSGDSLIQQLEGRKKFIAGIDTVHKMSLCHLDELYSLKDDSQTSLSQKVIKISHNYSKSNSKLKTKAKSYVKAVNALIFATHGEVYSYNYLNRNNDNQKLADKKITFNDAHEFIFTQTSILHRYLQDNKSSQKIPEPAFFEQNIRPESLCIKPNITSIIFQYKFYKDKEGDSKAFFDLEKNISVSDAIVTNKCSQYHSSKSIFAHIRKRQSTVFRKHLQKHKFVVAKEFLRLKFAAITTSDQAKIDINHLLYMLKSTASYKNKTEKTISNIKDNDYCVSKTKKILSSIIPGTPWSNRGDNKNKILNQPHNNIEYVTKYLDTLAVIYRPAVNQTSNFNNRHQHQEIAISLPYFSDKSCVEFEYDIIDVKNIYLRKNGNRCSLIFNFNRFYNYDALNIPKVKVGIKLHPFGKDSYIPINPNRYIIL